jgi:hypothetical protein
MPLLCDRAEFLYFEEMSEQRPWIETAISNARGWLRVPPEYCKLRVAQLPFWPGAELLAIEHTRLRGYREQ